MREPREDRRERRHPQTTVPGSNRSQRRRSPSPPARSASPRPPSTSGAPRITPSPKPGTDALEYLVERVEASIVERHFDGFVTRERFDKDTGKVIDRSTQQQDFRFISQWFSQVRRGATRDAASEAATQQRRLAAAIRDNAAALDALSDDLDPPE